MQKDQLAQQPRPPHPGAAGESRQGREAPAHPGLPTPHILGIEDPRDPNRASFQGWGRAEPAASSPSNLAEKPFCCGSHRGHSPPTHGKEWLASCPSPAAQTAGDSVQVRGVRRAAPPHPQSCLWGRRLPGFVPTHETTQGGRGQPPPRLARKMLEIPGLRALAGHSSTTLSQLLKWPRDPQSVGRGPCQAACPVPNVPSTSCLYAFAYAVPSRWKTLPHTFHPAQIAQILQGPDDSLPFPESHLFPSRWLSFLPTLTPPARVS